jgi:hypothetical protein
METKSIEEIKTILGYSDLRTVRKWCIDNNVLIIKQGKTEFVFETNFRLALELPFINKLKKKFGDDWESVYNLYKDGTIPLNIEIT